MKRLVSAIIPTYNRANYVTAAIESALAQHFDDLEIIVVDDGSTDLTSEVIKPYLDRIQYIRQDNKGEAVARNTAIMASQGEYVALLDSDDLWLPGKLARQVSFLEANPDVGMVACHAIAIDARGDPLGDTPLYPFQGHGWVSLETVVLRSPLPVDTLIIRRKCLPTPTPFTPGVVYGADWEMCLRLGSRAPIWFIDETLAAVRVHDNNITVPLATQSAVDMKLESRLGVIERVFPILADDSVLSGDTVLIDQLRSRAQARELAEASIPTYLNRAYDVASSRLGKAITLDSRWDGEDLITLICNFAKLVFLQDGETATLSFLDSILGHLPSEVSHKERLAMSITGRTMIFTIGFDAARRKKPKSAVANIIRGLLCQPTYVGNLGVLSTLGRAALEALRFG